MSTASVAEAVAQAAATSIAAAFAKASNENAAVAGAVRQQTVKSQIQLALASSSSSAQLTGTCSDNEEQSYYMNVASIWHQHTGLCTQESTTIAPLNGPEIRKFVNVPHKNLF